MAVPSDCNLPPVKNNGLSILKPWKIATSMGELQDILGESRCPGKEEHPAHAPCAGSDAAMSGFYTDTLVDMIHEAYARHVQQQETPVAMALKRVEGFLSDVNQQLEVDTATAGAHSYVDPFA